MDARVAPPADPGRSLGTRRESRQVIEFEFRRAKDPVATLRGFYEALSAEARALSRGGLCRSSPELISRFNGPGFHLSYLEGLAERDPSTWRAWFATTKEDHARIVGCGECCLDLSDRTHASFGSLVRAEYQGRGIGRKLAGKLLQDARDLGATYLDLQFAYINSAVRKLALELESVQGLRRIGLDCCDAEVSCTYAI